jgi:2'-5' RNA ligase
MSSTSYALWLKPSGPAYDVLATAIHDLAREFDAPIFEPHVTLLADLDGTEEQHLQRIKALAQQLHSFQITLTEASYGREYFQCVFLRAEQSIELMRARALAQQAFHQVGNAYMPHVSLIYGVFGDARKLEIINRLPRGLRRSFAVNAVYLLRAGSPDPKDWYEVAILPMSD